MNHLLQYEKTFPVPPWKLFLFFASYRRGMPVTEIMIFPSAFGETGYYRCPRCGITMEREFMAFCDRCGQCLDWEDYEQTRIVYPGQREFYS